MDWDAVDKSYQLVAGGLVDKVEGPGWRIYRVPNDRVVRIDINTAETH